MNQENFTKAIALIQDCEYERAANIFKQIDDENNEFQSIAKHYLGWMHEQGLGLPQSNSLAFEYWCDAAQLGFLTSQEALADCYLDGTGTHKNYVKALAWFLVVKFGDRENEMGPEIDSKINQLRNSLSKDEIEKANDLVSSIRQAIVQ